MPKPRAKTREVRRRIWEFVRDYRRDNLYGPNLREIAQAVGISSASNVNYHVKPMIEQGLLTGDSNARSLNVKTGIPVLGTVSAGTTAMSIDGLQWDRVSEFDTIEFPDWIVGNVREPFALEAVGNSMVDSGIVEDDVLILEQTKRAKKGDMVIAHIKSSDTHTVKRFHQNGPKVTLQPDNKNLEPIIVDADDVEIQGRVIAVVRRY